MSILAIDPPISEPEPTSAFVDRYAAVALAVPSGIAAPGDLLGASLVAIAAMTFPHVVVAGLDRRQGVSRP